MPVLPLVSPKPGRVNFEISGRIGIGVYIVVEPKAEVDCLGKFFGYEKREFPQELPPVAGLAGICNTIRKHNAIEMIVLLNRWVRLIETGQASSFYASARNIGFEVALYVCAIWFGGYYSF